MGHPEVVDQNSLKVCSSKPDHAKSSSKQNGFNTAKVIDLNCTGISDLPTFKSSPSSSLQSITCLYLNHNKLSSIPCGFHNVLPNLQVLSAIENELFELPSDICELKYLQEIHICKNKLTVLPHSLYKLKQLRCLNVSDNRLKALYPEIGQNVNLEELYVNNNVLKRFPSTFGLLVNLRVLAAANNQLENIPQTIHFLTRLQVMNLKCNKLALIPDSFSKLENVKHIDLSENRISTLWQSFASACSLETIILDFNLISTLPPWFSQLDNIHEICVAKNNLRKDDSFPLDFGKRLACLKKLDLRGNMIEQLPQSFGNLSNLQTLLLGAPFETVKENDDHIFQNGNWITDLPSNFTNLKHLIVLAAEDNQISNLPQDFGSLALLKDLRLGGNLLTSLPKSFCKLESLETCQLSKNRLKSLPEEFGYLDKLKKLCLDFNKLKSLPLSLKNCVQLEVLDLRGNRFSQAPSDILNVLTGLKDLKLVQEEESHDLLTLPNSCTADSDDEVEDCDFNDTSHTECWDDDSKSSSSGSSIHHALSVKDDEENWDDDLNTCQSAVNQSSNNELLETDAGQFELDGEEKTVSKSTGTTFDVYGNASQRIDLNIGQHRMLPYLLHQPRNVWGEREDSPEVVEDQYDDAV